MVKLNEQTESQLKKELKNLRYNWTNVIRNVPCLNITKNCELFISLITLIDEWLLNFGVLLENQSKKSWKISHKNLHNRSYSIYWFFFFRILIVMITVLVAIIYRRSRGIRNSVFQFLTFCIIMYMYQHAYLD